MCFIFMSYCCVEVLREKRGMIERIRRWYKGVCYLDDWENDRDKWENKLSRLKKLYFLEEKSSDSGIFDDLC